MTASLDDGVLPGVMRARVLQAAALMGLRVQEQAPCWQDRSAWLEMFVSNALRGVQPVASVVMPGVQGSDSGSAADAGGFELPRACGPVTQALQHLVLTLLDSTAIQL
jgi:branched-subunit amino acid aminotransferase/4-amino-4-deoxychorismate lyase